MYTTKLYGLLQLGETAVHFVCRTGSTNCVEWLLTHSSIPPDFEDVVSHVFTMFAM